MHAIVADRNFQAELIADAFISFIWTDRYLGYGEFEFYAPISQELIDVFTIDKYVFEKSSDRVMIVETRETTTDAEAGPTIKISGRSLESILERRIVWKQTVLKGKLQAEVKRLLTENLIDPTNPARKIENFVFKESTDERITTLDVDTQFFGETLYDAIYSLCEDKKIAFRIRLTADNQFEFELFVGADRTYAQTENVWVVFSPAFDNLLSSDHLESRTTLKNVALSAGEGEGSDRKTSEVFGDKEPSGLDRRELFVDASGVSSTTEDGSMLESEYLEQLKEKGKESLSENKETDTFEGEIESSIQYVYGRDFFIGDLVQVENEFGRQAISRVTEMVRCQDQNGYTEVPTFVTEDKKEEETN